jgi:Zn-dependent peptidase ImmA (M78 family)
MNRHSVLLLETEPRTSKGRSLPVIFAHASLVSPLVVTQLSRWHLNPKHSLSRRTFTIAHEFGHLVFDHRAIDITAEGIPQSRYSDEQELEAHSYGLAVLLPYAPLLQILRQHATPQSIAFHYGMSTDAVEMRLKITGLWEMLTLE